MLKVKIKELNNIPASEEIIKIIPMIKRSKPVAAPKIISKTINPIPASSIQ